MCSLCQSSSLASTSSRRRRSSHSGMEWIHSKVLSPHELVSPPLSYFATKDPIFLWFNSFSLSNRGGPARCPAATNLNSESMRNLSISTMYSKSSILLTIQLTAWVRQTGSFLFTSASTSRKRQTTSVLIVQSFGFWGSLRSFCGDSGYPPKADTRLSMRPWLPDFSGGIHLTGLKTLRGNCIHFSVSGKSSYLPICAVDNWQSIRIRFSSRAIFETAKSAIFPRSEIYAFVKRKRKTGVDDSSKECRSVPNLSVLMTGFEATISRRPDLDWFENDQMKPYFSISRHGFSRNQVYPAFLVHTPCRVCTSKRPPRSWWLGSIKSKFTSPSSASPRNFPHHLFNQILEVLYISRLGIVLAPLRETDVSKPVRSSKHLSTLQKNVAWKTALP